MRNTLEQFRTAQELNSEVGEGQVLDTVMAFIKDAGWTWKEPQVAVDPAGCAHYITAELGFADQVFQVYRLHKQLASLGMLA